MKANDPLIRALQFLASMRAVWMGMACLTMEGAEYLNVPFSFPSGDIPQQLPTLDAEWDQEGGDD